MSRIGWNTEILSWMLKVGLLLRSDLNREASPAGAISDILTRRARAVGGDPKAIRVNRGQVETRSRFGWTPIGKVREIHTAAFSPKKSNPKSKPKPKCLECSRPAEYGVYCGPCKGRLGAHAFTKSEVPKSILKRRGHNPSGTYRGVQYEIKSKAPYSGIGWFIPSWKANSSGAFYDGVPEHPEGAYAWAEAACKKHIDKTMGGRSAKSNPLSCWNCRTSLRSGQDICPTCSAGQYEENPLTDRESRDTLLQGIGALKSSRDAAPRSAEMGYQIGRTIGYTTPVQRFGTGASRKRAERVRGLAREKARQEGILAGGKVKRRNPLDSHKPGCKCLFHSGRIFQKGNKK